MAFNQTLEIPAHPNIYNENNERIYRIDYSIPENGTNEETGIIIFVPGFGGDIDSNVYKKMREQFADQYNLVTVQCDYFGNKFMQDSTSFFYSINDLSGKLAQDDFEKLKSNPNDLIEIIKDYNVQLVCQVTLDETENEFNDMGYMQAIDIITAVEAIKIILNENGLTFNQDRIFGYGHSQGAYLLHLANKLSPHLFTYIVDNSAWVEPVYLSSNRYLNKFINNALLQLEFDYLAKRSLTDKKALSLHNLYKAFKNGAYIYSVIGTTDNLVNVSDKKKSIEKLKYTKFEVIDQSKVDGSRFKSTNHGLDADFLKFFDYALKKLPPHQNKVKIKESYTIASSQTQIHVDYSHGLPLFQFVNR